MYLSRMQLLKPSLRLRRRCKFPLLHAEVDLSRSDLRFCTELIRRGGPTMLRVQPHICVSNMAKCIGHGTVVCLRLHYLLRTLCLLNLTPNNLAKPRPFLRVQGTRGVPGQRCRKHPRHWSLYRGCPGRSMCCCQLLRPTPFPWVSCIQHPRGRTCQRRLGARYWALVPASINRWLSILCALNKSATVYSKLTQSAALSQHIHSSAATVNRSVTLCGLLIGVRTCV